MPKLRPLGFAALLVIAATCAFSQTPGQNTNMVSGREWPGGDPFLQRQNEPSIAISTRNPQHIFAGANDYRTVDLPASDTVSGGVEVTGDAWLGVFKSFDGGQTWRSTLIPGYPQDSSAQGLASPLKGFSTAADAVVRAGTNGLFYYSGIAFNRGTNTGVVFISRWMDLNNKENGDPTKQQDSIRYISASIIDKGNAGQFLDKPWLAVDVPRSSATCTMQVPQANGTSVAQTVPTGNVYLAYTVLVGNDVNIRTKLYLTRSTDCGATWSTPTKLSEGLPVNQGANVAIDPSTGYVYVAWRGFAAASSPNTINIVRSTDGGASFTKAVTLKSLPSYNASTPTAESFFDQGTTATSFRSSAFPTMAVDANGRVYVAWSQRTPPNGDARIMMTSSADFATWTTPAAVDNSNLSDDAGVIFSRGHQFMPSLTFSDGRLMLIYYDERFDHTVGVFTPNSPFLAALDGRFYTEKRDKRGELTVDPTQVFTPFVSDFNLTQMRHTTETRVAEALPGSNPSFTSTRISQYKFGMRGDESGSVSNLQQLQINPPNLPLFEQGTVPFIGDYIDIAGLSMINTPSGWKFNTALTKAPRFIASYTSNQDVRPPLDGNWQNYTPAGQGGKSILDPTQNVPACQVGQEGMRDQNIYSSVITEGLGVAALQNTKPLSTSVPREFVLTVQNATNFDKSFRITIGNQPAGGIATLLPILNPVPNPLPAPLTTLDVSIAAHSGVARGVYALSATPTASISVNVAEITSPGGSLTAGGLTSFVTLNSDPTVSSLTDPDGGGDVGISTAEIYNPNVSNPNVSNPNVSNPNVSNPNVSNPNVSNPNVSNPNVSNPNVSNQPLANANVSNPNVSNPNVSNPNVSNPNVSNPNVSNPNVSNAPVSDATYTITNHGNTSSSYTVKLVGDAPSAPLQIIISKPYSNPTSVNCQLADQQNNILLDNVNSAVVLPPTNLSDPLITNPNISNPTVALAPGESALITIRGINVTLEQMSQIVGQIAPVVVAQAPNTNDPTNTPPVATPFFITTSSQLPTATAGQQYSTPLSVVGGTAPYSWAVVSGFMPKGFVLTPGRSSATEFIANAAPGSNGPGTYNFTVQVTDASAATTTKQFTVVMNNLGNLSFVSQPAASTVGQAISPAVQVRLLDNTGAPIATFPVNLALGNAGSNPGGGVLSGTTSVLTDATGIATFPNLSIDQAGTGYNLIATGQNLTPTMSTPFDESVAVTPFVGRATDPTGDSSGADLTSATVNTSADGNVTLSVRYAPGTFSGATTEADFLLDTDQKTVTGSPGSDAACQNDATVLGTDYLVIMQSNFGNNTAHIYKATGGCNQYQELGTASVTLARDGMDVTFPLSMLTNTASATTSGPASSGPWNFKVTTDSSIGNGAFSGLQDVMPDVGFVDSTTSAVITGVVFSGNAANPTITISGTGFGTAPTATTVGFPDFTGFDYGDALYIEDFSNNPQAFSAGRGLPNNAQQRDFIGLVIVSYTDTSITYQLGSDYSLSYYPSGQYALNAGDSFNVVVAGGASFSGTVSYNNVVIP